MSDAILTIIGWTLCVIAFAVALIACVAITAGTLALLALPFILAWKLILLVL